jgi:hypothetical protein
LLCLLLAGTGAMLAAFQTPAPAAASVNKAPELPVRPAQAPAVPKPALETGDEKPAPAAAAADEFAPWITQLGDEDLDRRIEAITKLKAADAAVTPALEAATRHENYDISSRAARILEVRKLLPLVQKLQAALKEPKTVQYQYTASLNMQDVVAEREATVADASEAQVHVAGNYKGHIDGSRYIGDATMTTKAAAFNIKQKLMFIQNAKGYWVDFDFGDIHDQKEKNEKVDIPSRRVVWNEQPGTSQKEDLDGLTASVFRMFEFTKVTEREIDGVALYELSGYLREDLLFPDGRKKAIKIEGESGLDIFKSMKKAVVRFAKKDNWIRSGEVFNEADVLIAALVINELKLDPEFSPTEFDYTPPEGVTVENLSDLAKKHGDTIVIDQPVPEQDTK